MRAYDDSRVIDELQAKYTPRPPMVPTPLQVLVDKLRAHPGRATAGQASQPIDVNHGLFK